MRNKWLLGAVLLWMSLLTATVAPAANLSGKVNNTLSTPLSGVTVGVYDTGGGPLDYSGISDASGNYYISGIPAPADPSSNYYVKVQFSKTGYASQWYNGASGSASAQLVPLFSSSTINNINGTLTATTATDGAISGRLSTTSSVPLSGVTVGIYDTFGGSLGSSGSTDASGNYYISPIPLYPDAAGNYYVKIQFSKTGYTTRWYSGASSSASAQPVSLHNGITTSGINEVLSATVSWLSVTLNGTGSGSVQSNPSGLACVSGTCSSTFPTGSTVTLLPSPGGASLFQNWSGACSGSGGCVLSLNGDRSVNATFSLPSPAMIGATPFLSPQLAYEAANPGEIIKLKEGNPAGGLTTDKDKSVTIRGGYRPDYSTNDRDTVMQGPVILRSGSVFLDKVGIR